MGKKEPVFYSKRRKKQVALAVAILAGLYALILWGNVKWSFSATLLLIPAFAFLAWSLRRPRLNTSSKGRHGLLNTDVRSPLRPPERAQFIVDMVDLGKDYSLMQKLSDGKPSTRFDIKTLETIRLLALWQKTPKQPLSDDEVRSIHLLTRVSFTGKDGNIEPIHPEDAAIIGDWETINAFRDRIQAFVNAEKEKAAEYQVWLDIVGNLDARHLIEDGWIAFLETFEIPDIQLWHNIATIFHDLFGEQLNAAYWILEQPECDKATVYSFMAGYVGYEDLKGVLEDARHHGKSTMEAARAFVSVVNRWNDGFYKWHSLAFDEDETPNEHIGDGAALNDQLQALSSEFGTALPLIENLDFNPTNPNDDLSRSKSSVFGIFDGESLHLKYPNLWPEKYGTWPPN